MARVKTTPEDVELERIRAGIRKAELICNTVRWCGFLTAASFCVYIIAGAAVQISNKPAWLEFALALIAVGTPPSAGAWWLSVRLKRQVKLTEATVASAEPAVPEPTAQKEDSG